MNLGKLTRQNPDKVLDSNFVTSVIDLNVVSVQVKSSSWIRVHAAGELVPRVTCSVIRKH